MRSRKAPARPGRRTHEPVLVDIGEFEKLEGRVTCLSVRLRRPYA